MRSNCSIQTISDLCTRQDTARRKHPGHHKSKERTMSDLKESTSTLSTEAQAAPAVDLKLEIVVIPVSDVERAKQFYASLGWRLDADFAGPDDYRVIQFTPPGSNASVIFGKNV